MKIKKSQLKKLVESYLSEVGLGPDPGDSSKSVSQHTRKTDEESDTTDKAVKSAKEIIDISKLATMLKPIKDVKEWAQIENCDRYFHYLAFYIIVQEMTGKIPSLKQKLIKLGETKEAIDYWGSTTAWWRVGEEASLEEFAKDMSINKQGIEDSIKVLRGEMDPGDVINKAYGFLEYVPSEKGLKNWKKNASDGSRPSYLYWFENRSDLYGQGKVFMHPVLNVKLSPEERKKAYSDLYKHVADKPAHSNIIGSLGKIRKLSVFTF